MSAGRDLFVAVGQSRWWNHPKTKTLEKATVMELRGGSALLIFWNDRHALWVGEEEIYAAQRRAYEQRAIG